MYSIDGIGARIALKRKSLGLTQESFAEKIGVSPQAVSKWETGVGCPDISLLPSICRSLDLSMDELFGREAPPVKPEGFDFPEQTDDLQLQGSLGGVACYADSKGKQEGKTVTFEDGSEADLHTGTVVNRGSSDIRLLFADAMHRAADTIRGLCDDMYGEAETKDGDCDSATSISADILGSCDLSLRPSDDGRLHWSAEGSPAFLEGLSIETRGGVCCITSRPQGAGFISRSGKLDVRTPSALMSRLEARIKGSGDISSSVDFEETDILIAGSGDVDLKDAGETRVRINGSGDFTAAHAANGLFEVSGSGDVRLGRVSGSLYCRVAGSGDFDIDTGEVDELSIRLTGSGDFSARGLTANTLNATLSGASDAVIGCVKGKSVETVSRASTLRVLKRG